MKRYWVLVFAIYSNFAMASEMDLNSAMQKAAFKSIPEWEQAYGEFDADKAQKDMEKGVQAKDHPMGKVFLEAQKKKWDAKSVHEWNVSMDQLASNVTLLEQNENSLQKEPLMTVHQCFETQGAEVFTSSRHLEIEVEYTPELKEIKILCIGHTQKKHYFYKSEADEKEKEWVHQFKNDPDISSYSVDLEGSVINGYDVMAHFKHQVGTKKCKRHRKSEKIKRAEVKRIIKEEWVEEGLSAKDLQQDPDITILDKKCMDPGPSKMINGLLVERPCWKEQIAFMRSNKNNRECEELRKKNCQFLGAKCVEGSEADCQRWELTFKCLDLTQVSIADPFSQETVELDPIEPNTSFNEVVAKLSVFQAMKNEIVEAKAFDPKTLQIFKGADKKCNKSIASDVVYDCCFAYAGLATKLGLAKCNADELALASLREEGLCHFVGVKEDTLLDLVTTNYEHVFCCFPTKLARVLNEEAREQLGIGWGDSKHPNCQGFSVEQMQKINFDSLNLEEVFEKDLEGVEKRFGQKTEAFKDPDKSKMQMEAIKEKMKAKLKVTNAV